jgi:hypothetical protein
MNISFCDVCTPVIIILLGETEEIMEAIHYFKNTGGEFHMVYTELHKAVNII